MKNSYRENFALLWPAYIVLVIAIVLQVFVSHSLTIGPRYLIAGLESVLLLGINATLGEYNTKWRKIRWWMSLGVIALVTVSNIASLILVSKLLIDGSSHIDGHQLILSALAIYLTNIIIFGLMYWELDTPGLTGKRDERNCNDFLFPQVADMQKIWPNWQPGFYDYIYISITNATAFSPTDAMPVTQRAKMLMTVQSLTSFVTVALVAARAINILN